MKKLYLLIISMIAITLNVSAQQIVTTSPSPLQESSRNVVLTYHADQGNKGLMGLTASTPVYAHIGVITNLSNGQWAYGPSKWCDNAPKYKLDYVSANTWKLNIGNIRSYFGITNPNETVEKIAVVFRNVDGSLEGKTASGGDIFVDVLPEGFFMSFTSDAPKIISSLNSTVNFTAVTTQPSSIKIYLGSTDSQPVASVASATQLTYKHTFTTGDYKVIAVADNGTQTIEQTIDICYAKNSQPVAYPGGGTPKMGAVAQPDGSVIFCIAAPGKNDAMLIGAWDDYRAKASNVMNYTDVDGIRYFWLSVSGLDNDTEYPYYYLIDSSISVGDPYARLVLDPYNDKWLGDGQYPGLIPYPADKIDGNVMLAVYKGTRDNYDWRVKDFVGPAQSDLIIYELLLRDFTGTEGKAYGDGTIRLAMEKLDYLQNLGVNAIELMPIQEFNGNNSWGYNTNFYFAPDKAYGSPDDYRMFIDECHSRGIAVILDVVFNQSDGLHPWYQMYPAGSNPFYNASAPHAYSVLNDWLQDNMLVQQQWIDMITYWMTAYKVDGFRFDLVKGLGDNASYGGNASEYNTNKYNPSRIARMKALTDVMFAINPHSYSINENLAGATEENAMAANGQLNWANINDPSCQFAMGYSSGSNLNRFYAPDDGNRLWGSTVSYAESHDEQRVAYKQNMYAVSSVKGNLDVSMHRLGSLAAQMILAPGAHMIWQFGELGNATNTKNANGGNNTDPKPVLWSYFDVPARHGLYDNYSELIGIRNANPDLFAQTASYTMQCAESDWNRGRFIYASTADKELICVINPNPGAATISGVTFKVADNSHYRVISSSYDATVKFDATTGKVTLNAGCYAVIVNDKVSPGIHDITADSDHATGVIGVDGKIVVSGSYDTVNVYTLSGRSVAPTGLVPGVYIVVVDGVAHKVAVR